MEKIQKLHEVLVKSTSNIFILNSSKGPFMRLLQGCGGGGGGGSQNPDFNPIPEAWLAINSNYLKK